MKKIIIALGTVCFMTALLGACNTVQGAGEDIQKGGQEIQKAAVKNK